jgi:flagellar biosynthesis/type III secretory pathway protein FliH
MSTEVLQNTIVSPKKEAESTQEETFCQTKTDEYKQVYEDGKKEGYDEGFDEGCDEGYDIGYEKGYEQGKKAGYEEGYEAGQSEWVSLKRTDIITRMHNIIQKLKDEATLMKQFPQESWKSMSLNERKHLTPTLTNLMNNSEILF